MIIYEPQNEVCRKVTKQDRYEVLQRQHWKCNNCGCSLKYSDNSSWKGELAHIDHIHPYSLRDSYIHGPEMINELQNLQGLCPKCNKTKHQHLN